MNADCTMTATFSQEYQFYKSLQQTVLSRSFVHYACYSSESRRLLLFLANSQVSETVRHEAFLPISQWVCERDLDTSQACVVTRSCD